ncbi:MAG: MFS transporter [Proteobacteria bacterium]|nr:MFS transporter [Pseudomonadota bacterium]
MSDSSINKKQRKITLMSGSILHIFHDGIADGLGIFLPLWQVAFGLTFTQVGLLVTCFEGVTALFQIPAGFLGERFGERKPLLIGTLVTATSFMFLGFTGGLVSFVALLVIGGLGASVQHPLASSMVSKAYEGDRRIALGTYNFSGDIGKFLFPSMAAIAMIYVDWNLVCVGFGLIGCVITAAMFFVFKKNREIGNQIAGKHLKVSSDKKGWGIANKNAFTTLSLIGVLDTAVRTALITFGPFLFIQKGIEAESVGFALSLLFIGGAIGKFVCGVIAERIGIITTVIITETITGCGILLLTELPLFYIYLLLPLLGAGLNGTSSVLYGTVADFVETQKVGRAFGLFYTIVVLASAAAPPIMGRISDSYGIDNSLRVVGVTALVILPMTFILAKQMKK